MRIVITGSSGLIGSAAVEYFDAQGHECLGLDNNMRREFFGERGDTDWNRAWLERETERFEHRALDIRDRAAIMDLFEAWRPDAIIHCAAQPSHDLAARRPFDDFEVNAQGTLILLEAARRYAAESPFVLMSTNKVYGDAPNELALVERETRWDYADPADYNGIDEDCRIDRSKHSLFGASKLAADILTQEYGRYFDMPTVCFRGGCLTGTRHSAVELHGFLSYLVKVAVHGERFTIFGYKGKQVRDQLDSGDVVRAMEAFIKAPRRAEVYNLGGGRNNAASILECIAKVEALLGREIETHYDARHREGDHVCYISDLTRLCSHYPEWSVTRSLDSIIERIVEFELAGIDAAARPAAAITRAFSDWPVPA